MAKRIAKGAGHRRPLIDVSIENLHLDPSNPRLPEEIQGKKEPELMRHLLDHFDLDELASSMSTNGYFDEEPVIAIPLRVPRGLLPKPSEEYSDEYKKFINRKDTQFLVVEGNRRLATAKLLISEDLRKQFKLRGWPAVDADVKSDLSTLPVIVYPTRKEVLPYLGVRHITGIKKWDSYAKARYIAAMVAEGSDIGEIETAVGDKAQSVRRNAVAYFMLKEAAEELDYDTKNAEQDFSLLLLAIGQRGVKHFLGWYTGAKDNRKTLRFDAIDLDTPVGDNHLDNLRLLLRWLFGEGSKVRPVIRESRDITNYLTAVLESSDALEYLKAGGDLREAYELTDGEEVMLKKLLRNANTRLEKALGIAHRHKTDEVEAEVERCFKTVVELRRAVRGANV